MIPLSSKHNQTIVITPSRGRPENFYRMVDACQKLSAGGVTVFAGLDKDDPKLWEYHELKYISDKVLLHVEERKSLSAWTNQLARYAIESFGTKNVYLVSMGDDHVVRSNFWDLRLINGIRSLDGPGFAYGDDMMNGSGLCTCWMVSAIIVEKLGWMMLPKCNHMYVDNVIMELGEASNSIKYVPSAIIEHMHPAIKKSEIDTTYMDSEISYVPDLENFRNWRNSPDFVYQARTITDLKMVTNG